MKDYIYYFWYSLRKNDNQKKFDYIHLTCPWNHFSLYTSSNEDFPLILKGLSKVPEHLLSKEAYENNS